MLKISPRAAGQSAVRLRSSNLDWSREASFPPIGHLEYSLCGPRASTPWPCIFGGKLTIAAAKRNFSSFSIAFVSTFAPVNRGERLPNQRLKLAARVD